MMPNGKGTTGAGASNGKGLKGGVLSPEQPSAAPEEGVAPQQAITQGAAPVAPEPTSGILVMVTQEKYQKLPSAVPQGKSYKHTPVIPQATPEPAPAIPQGKDPKPAPEPAPIGPKAATSGPAPESAAAIPQGKYPKPGYLQCLCSVVGRKYKNTSGSTVCGIIGSTILTLVYAHKHNCISGAMII